MAGNGRVGTLPDVAEKLTAEIGRSGLHAYGGVLHEEFDADLRGLRGIRVFEEMRRSDPTIAAGLRAINWLIGQVNWSAQPGGSTKEDEQAAEFLDSCREDMSIAWSRHIRDALTSVVFGWSLSEVVYKVRNGPGVDPPSRHDDGRVGWRKLVLIGHDSLSRWQLDDRGGIQGLVQAGVGIGGPAEVTIPIGKSVLYRLEDEKNSPEGTSLLRPVALAWYTKKQLQEIEAIGIERDLTGVLIIHLPITATNTDFTKARDLLEQYKADDMTGFIAPQFGPGDHERWRFEIINSPGSKSIDPGKVIERYQVEIARAFLAQFIMLGQSSSGSWALGRDMRDMFEVALTSIVVNLEETMNRFLVPPLFRLNDFGKLTAIPQLKAGRLSKTDLEKFTAALQSLAQAGLLTADKGLESFIRDELELPQRVEVQAPEQQPEEETGEDAEQEETAQNPQEEDTGQEAREMAERAVSLPDPEDDAAWAAWERGLQEDWDERVGRRSLVELLRFARGYDYDGKLMQYGQQFQDRMGGLLQQLQDGKMTASQWEYRSKVEILTHNQQAYRVGVAKSQGIPPSQVKLTQPQRRAANGLVEEQYKHFADLSEETRRRLKAGEDLAALEHRVNMYGKAAKFAAVRGDVGGRGSQVLRWVRRLQDSCDVCISQDNVEKTASEWQAGGIMPGVNVTCRSNCGCELVPVR